MSFNLTAARTGSKLRFRSGCEVKFIAHVPDAKPHCRLVLLNPATGNIVTRYESGKSADEPIGHSDPGDILMDEVVRGGRNLQIIADPDYVLSSGQDCTECAFNDNPVQCLAHACIPSDFPEGTSLPAGTEIIWLKKESA